MKKKKISRRNFLRNAAYATCGGAAHGLMRPIVDPMRAYSFAAVPGAKLKTVVLCHFGGGGPLNIYPQTDGFWIDAFEELAYPGTAIPISARLALHPQFDGIKDLWDEGKVNIVTNCGYYNPSLGVGVNRSHADSTNIFFGGRPDLETPSEGWAVRLTNQIATNFAGMSVSGSNFLTEGGLYVRGFGDFGSLGESLYNLGGGDGGRDENWKALRDSLMAAGESGNYGEVPFVKAANDNIDLTVEQLATQTDPDDNPLPLEGLFNGSSGFMNDLEDVARVINAPALGCRFLYASMGGYDTHRGEVAALNTRLNQWNDAIMALWRNIEAMPGNLDECTAIVTQCDFGRTSRKNGSAGTDHGHGTNMMVISNAFGGNSRIHGEPITQSQLTSGGSYVRDINYEFPRIFAEIVAAMGLDPGPIFGANYPSQGLGMFP